MQPIFRIGQGLDEYVKNLSSLYAATDEIIERAVYPGGKVIADQMKKEIGGIKADGRIGTPENPVSGLTPQQIQGLKESMGLAPMANYGGLINTKAGFDGYNSVKTKKYPNGQPNALIARSVNSGTSFRRKDPFIDRTFAKAGNRAEQEMKGQFEIEVNKIMS